MFLHIYKYRIKSLLRSKEEVFWCFLFPILLATCFHVAFSAIGTKAYDFHSIPVAIVTEQENPAFTQTLDAIAKDDSQGEPFLIVKKVSSQKANDLLSDKKVDAIITLDEQLRVTIAQNGLNQTAIQSFVNQFLQKSTVINDIASAHPETLNQIIEQMKDESSVIKEQSLTKSKIDPLICYYLSLIGMAALFGGFLGTECARQMKANLSNVGMRKCISPTHRLTMILAEFFATYTLHLLAMMVLLLYMIFGLHIDLGNQIGYLILTCITGSLVGVSSGFFIGSLSKLSEIAKVTIFLIFSLGSSFLSGLMVSDIKIAIQHHAPIINHINPGTLIQDALYSLLIFETHERFYTNMITLVIYAVLFCGASYFMTRRESYASL